ncbi:MAG: hypothetical protein FJW36_19485 [Acidobacteria bacterium]|nr:hypothetical protein [Acidobacteriota bacterium]
MQKIVLVALMAGSAFAADLTGKWACEVNTDAGSGSPSFEFAQKGEALTGRYSGQLGEAEVTGTLKGEKASWSFEAQGAKILYEGTVVGAEVKGKVDLAGQATGTFSCKRK